MYAYWQHVRESDTCTQPQVACCWHVAIPVAGAVEHLLTRYYPSASGGQSRRQASAPQYKRQTRLAQWCIIGQDIFLCGYESLEWQPEATINAGTALLRSMARNCLNAMPKQNSILCSPVPRNRSASIARVGFIVGRAINVSRETPSLFAA